MDCTRSFEFLNLLDTIAWFAFGILGLWFMNFVSKKLGWDD